jgi:hypothetical protein
VEEDKVTAKTLTKKDDTEVALCASKVCSYTQGLEITKG